MMRHAKFTAVLLLLASMPSVALAFGVGSDGSISSSWTDASGTTITGFSARVAGSSCVADYVASNPRWGRASGMRSRTEWKAVKAADGSTRCTGGRWTNLENGNSGAQRDIVIRAGKAYVK
ncbi:MAG: hypothetical protein ACRCYS_07040 [Beijerinckiaceae bacterium]